MGNVKWGNRVKHKLIILIVLFSSVTLYAQDRRNALTLFRKGNYEEAITVCLEELETLPDSSFVEIRDSYTVLLWSFLGAKRYQDAVEYGLMAYEQSSGDWRIVASIGEAYFHLGNNKQALFFLEKYIELNPSGDKADYVYYLMGHVFLKTEEYNRADIALSMSVFLRPLEARWWARLGYAREQAKDFQRAKDAYNKALSINPTLEDAERGKERVHKSLGL